MRSQFQALWLAIKQARRVPPRVASTTTSSIIVEANMTRASGELKGKTTGLALLAGTRVIWAAELTHRGQRITAVLEGRRAMRRGRRQRKTRYRQARFLNRTRPAGWLPPSLWSRVCNVMTWVERLARYCPITALSQELVRFDM